MNPEEKSLRKIWDSIVPDLVEEHFPKGFCKERGTAIVLVALIYCKLLPKLCENCKEEKLNTVAEYFKKYNRSLKKKPKIDEEKLKEIIKIDFNKNMDIVTGAKKVWFSLSGLNKLAHAIAQKAEEIIKYK